MSMTRLDFLTMREDVVVKIENIIDENYGQVPADEIVGHLCDEVCKIMNPEGLD